MEDAPFDHAPFIETGEDAEVISAAELAITHLLALARHLPAAATPLRAPADAGRARRPNRRGRQRRP